MCSEILNLIKIFEIICFDNILTFVIKEAGKQMSSCR